MTLALKRGQGGYVVVNYKKDEEGYVHVEPIPSLITILAYNGASVRYTDHFFSPKVAARYFKELCAFEKHAANEKNPFTGKDIKRKTLQFADKGVRAYKYSSAGATSTLRWNLTSCLQEMLDMIHLVTGERPNFCLINFYGPDAQLSYHSDDEDDMVKGSTVASVSLGTVRRFKLRDKEIAKHKLPFIEGHNMWTLMLGHGSLLTMEGACQSVLEHSIPPMKCEGLRINCTFRRMKMLECRDEKCKGILHYVICEGDCDTLKCDECNYEQYIDQSLRLILGHAPWCEEDKKCAD